MNLSIEEKDVLEQLFSFFKERAGPNEETLEILDSLYDKLYTKANDLLDELSELNKRYISLTDDFIKLQLENEVLLDWKRGAMGAAIINYPPGVGPHTEEALFGHTEEYSKGSEAYRKGADFISASCVNLYRCRLCCKI